MQWNFQAPCMHAHCEKGIVILTDSLLLQIQMSEHNSLLCGGELHDNLFLILSQLSSTFSCVHASNWFTHLQQTRQIDGQNDNSVLTVQYSCCILQGINKTV